MATFVAGPSRSGGHCRLLPTGVDWVAINLSRPEDVASLPALSCGRIDPAVIGTDRQRLWSALAQEVNGRPAAEVVEAAQELGMPASQLGEVVDSGAAQSPWSIRTLGAALCDSGRPATARRGLHRDVGGTAVRALVGAGWRPRSLPSRRPTDRMAPALATAAPCGTPPRPRPVGGRLRRRRGPAAAPPTWWRRPTRCSRHPAPACSFRGRSRRRGLPDRRPRAYLGLDHRLRAEWPPLRAGGLRGRRGRGRRAGGPGPERRSSVLRRRHRRPGDRGSGGGRRAGLGDIWRRPPRRLLDVPASAFVNQGGRCPGAHRVERQGDGWMAFCDEAAVPVTRPWVQGEGHRDERSIGRPVTISSQ